MTEDLHMALSDKKRLDITMDPDDNQAIHKLMWLTAAAFSANINTASGCSIEHR